MDRYNIIKNVKISAGRRRDKRSGLKLGLWFEPEMVSPISKLHEAHPNWCVHVGNRERSEARNQLILDLNKLTEEERVLLENR
ncbi:MAG: alpha-galactosidase [Clostridia bacterium]|nr:alpha-galactosidase [Clostridia bacterium]